MFLFSEKSQHSKYLPSNMKFLATHPSSLPFHLLVSTQKQKTKHPCRSTQTKAQHHLRPACSEHWKLLTSCAHTPPVKLIWRKVVGLSVIHIILTRRMNLGNSPVQRQLRTSTMIDVLIYRSPTEIAMQEWDVVMEHLTQTLHPCQLH